MALLDAMALTRALQATSPTDVNAALRHYAAMRRWHRQAYQTFSALMTPMYQSHSRLLPALRDWGLAPLARLPGIHGVLTALVSGDVLPPMAGQIFP